MSIQIILKQNGLRECLPLGGGLTLFSEMREAENMHYGWAFKQIRFIGKVRREAKDLKNPKPCIPSENLHEVPRHVGPSLETSASG